MDVNAEKFQRTVTREIKAIQNRVRYLIGSANWGEEGRYKEAILRSVMRRFLPTTISLGTGFVLNRDAKDEVKISSQVDIIVYDNTYPVLFSEGDFVVTTPENVRGIIEVKTSLNSSNVAEILSKSTKNGHLIKQRIFNGIFVYNTKSGSLSLTNRLETELKKSRGVVNHLCLGKDIFIKFWHNWSTQNDLSHKWYSIYRIENLSFSYFISNLIEHVSKSNIRERLWFLYPIEKGKQRYNIKDIRI